MTDETKIPRVVLAALRGGAGKTFLSVGLVAALRGRGLSVAVFKKGPDYIDAGWLGLAAGSDCYNLDPYLVDGQVVLESFVRRSQGKAIAVVEGNRGLFDGVDAAGSYSTAELAKLLQSPVALIVDATKMTRTAAALVVGCRALDPDVDIRAVILNRVAGQRHETVLRESIEEAASVPVLGSVKKMALPNFPQRHLGLLPLHEHPAALEFVRQAAEVAEQSLDLDRVLEIASSAGTLQRPALGEHLTSERNEPGIRIGLLKDSAFQFYYPENLEALANGGAEIVEISALEPAELPEIDGLYIGGGFPETHAARLADNSIFRGSLRAAIGRGLPVYAECGGLMYLSRNLRLDDNVYPMLGVFPVEAVLERRPQGHGYIQVEVVSRNPFYPQGTVLRGHEFHYSYVTAPDSGESLHAFRVLRGHGMDGIHDGICKGNVLGTYVHVHALGTPLWSRGVIAAASEYRSKRMVVEPAGKDPD